MVLLASLKVQLHVATKAIYTLATKVILLTFKYKSRFKYKFAFDEKKAFSSQIYRKKWPKLAPSNKGLSRFFLLFFSGTINFGTY